MASSLPHYFITLTDYLKASWQAANRKVGKMPQALHDIYIARTHLSIGPRFFTLFKLNEKPRQSWSEYLIDEQLRPLLRAINHPEIRVIVTDKAKFYDHCQKTGLATIPILTRFRVDERGQFQPGDYDKLLAALIPEGNTSIERDFFCKKISGTWGSGAFRFKLLPDQRWSFGEATDELTRISQLCGQETAPGVISEWIVQPLLSAHRVLAAISSPYGLSTIRIISVLHDGVTIPLAAMLRITTGVNMIDNFSGGKTGNLIAAIDLNSGQLGSCKGSLSRNFPYMTVYQRHPDTGNPIEGVTIPYWRELIDLITQAHRSLPELITLAWDVAVTDQGPVIVEANPTYDVSGVQTAHDKGFRSLLFPYLQISKPELMQTTQQQWIR